MSKLLDALNAATADDLAELEEQIDQKKAELRKLEEAHAVVRKLLGLDAKLQKAKSTDTSNDGKVRRGQWFEAIVGEIQRNGPGSILGLSQRLGCSRQTVQNNVDKHRSEFVLAIGMVHLKAADSTVVPDAAIGADTLATRIFDLISEEGSMPVPAIAARLNQTEATVGCLVREHEWFTRTMQGEIDIRKTKGRVA